MDDDYRVVTLPNPRYSPYAARVYAECVRCSGVGGCDGSCSSEVELTADELAIGRLLKLSDDDLRQAKVELLKEGKL